MTTRKAKQHSHFDSSRKVSRYRCTTVAFPTLNYRGVAKIRHCTASCSILEPLGKHFRDCGINARAA